MFDQAQRSLWLEDQLWAKLREEFTDLKGLPSEILITVGYPSTGARGRSEKIRPCEISKQWLGNPNEKAFVSIHPIYFDSPRNAARALLFGMGKTLGARWGASKVGITKERDGSLSETPETTVKLDKVMNDVGEPPAGFGVPFPVREVQRTRLRKYVCSTRLCSGNLDHKGDPIPHKAHRVASDDEEFSCNRCGNAFVLDK